MPRYIYKPRNPVYLTLRLLEDELETVSEFYDCTEFSFRKRIKKLEAQIKPKSYWTEDVGGGMTRGEIVSDQKMDLESAASLTGYFGVIATYSIFERFLYDLFGYIKRFKMLVPPEFERKRWLDLKGYQRVLKANGIDITTPPIKYGELIKLLNLRNAIAHSGGWVTPDNAQKLKGYGYKEGRQVTISEPYFRTSVTLVRGTIQQVAEQFAQQVARQFAAQEQKGARKRSAKT
jgi:hypothetical protein